MRKDLNNNGNRLTVTRKLEAVLVTVASTVEEQNCRDLVNSVHITALQTNIMANINNWR